MKISVAQTRPVKGNIEANIKIHKKLVDLALAQSADIIIFPELSITGYEPELSKDLATTKEDSRFDVFQKMSNEHGITIGIGVPTKSEAGINISMVLFQRGIPRQVYSKKYLHSDELPFFAQGINLSEQIESRPEVALAICYELSVPEHSENAFKKGAEFYIASAVKDDESLARSIKTLSGIAKKYGMTVLLSNCIGETGGYDCPGRSSAWNKKGILLGQLDDEHEGILMIDTETEEVLTATIN